MFFSSCDSLVGHSLEFNQANRGSYVFHWENAIAGHAMQGNRASSRKEVQLFSDLRDYSPPGSFVHDVSQARILEWVTISFSRGSSQPRD